MATDIDSADGDSSQISGHGSPIFGKERTKEALVVQA